MIVNLIDFTGSSPVVVGSVRLIDGEVKIDPQVPRRLRAMLDDLLTQPDEDAATAVSLLPQRITGSYLRAQRVDNG